MKTSLPKYEKGSGCKIKTFYKKKKKKTLETIRLWIQSHFNSTMQCTTINYLRIINCQLRLGKGNKYEFKLMN